MMSVGSRVKRAQATCPEEATLFGIRKKGFPTLVGELKELTVDYAKQETIQPLKNLGRYLVFGIAGALALGIGLTFWVIALLRVLQTETGSTFEGDWSWAPYLITLAASVLVIGMSLWAIGKERRSAERRRTARANRHANQEA